ncbi:MAG: prepilin-type N-terminal cleavage/methylation domain-containing protein [Candidatus Eisenbacteria bacterium]|jgi:prepilin-type N-terminal cleavage/methylation domain-containing protein|nr:prepilin-type N-terminal cleavage/methylation domain-containing protein [Candidatus Eisenbacteria bacterium]
MRRRGLTLVEMIVALTIFGIVSAALFMVFRGHLSLSGPLQARADMIHDARASFDILSRELRHCSSIQSGQADSILFLARISGVSQTYKYALHGRSLRREAGGSGMQEVTERAVDLGFTYLNLEGNVVSPPITIANDQLVKRILVTVSVMLPDESDTFTVSGAVAPRNI